MKKKMLGAIVLVLVAPMGFGSTQAESDEADVPALTGLPGVKLIVEQIDPEAARIGLDTKTVRTQVATQLRRAGIPILADDYAVPVLRVRGRIVTRVKHPGVCAYSTEVRLEEYIHLCRTPHDLYRAATWSSTDVGLCSADELRQVLGGIETQIAEFILAYREGNPKLPSPTEAPTTTATNDREDPSGGLSDVSHVRDQYVSFPAARVKLLRPEGFDDAKDFHGFQQRTSQSSVMVTVIPGPFSEVTHGFTVEQMKTRGMTLKSKENIQIDGKSGVLLNVTQTAYGTDFAKWIVAFGNDQETVMATATFPRTHEGELSAKLKSVVLSAKLDHTAPPPPGADVGFTLVASAKLRLTRSGSKMLVYTKDGVVPAKSPEDPLFIAGPSLSKVASNDKRQFAVQRLFQTAHTKISSIRSNKAVSIHGLDGYEILADAEDSDSGTPLVFYQVILFDEGSYVLIQGLVGTKLSAEYLSEFKAMAHSLKIK